MFRLLKFCGKSFVSIAVPVTFFDRIGHPSSIYGTSMEPTLLGDFRYWWQRDFVWVDCWSVRKFQIKRGDVVVFKHPRRPETRYIKRITGVAGDIIKPVRGSKNIVVRTGECWVEADNKQSGEDSHDFGLVHLGLIEGKATWIIWPQSRWQAVDCRVPDGRLPVNERFSIFSSDEQDDLDLKHD